MELKPCPFCGNTEIRKGIKHMPVRGFFRRCSVCDASQSGTTEELADYAWNRRATPSNAAMKTLEDVRDILQVCDSHDEGQTRKGVRHMLAKVRRCLEAHPTPEATHRTIKCPDCKGVGHIRASTTARIFRCATCHGSGKLDTPEATKGGE